MKKTRITIIISIWKPCLSPSEMQKYSRIVFVKKKNVRKKIILVHKWLPILLNAFDSVLLYYRTVKRLLIPILQIRVRNGKLFLLFLNQNIFCGYLNGPIKWDGSFEDQKYTLYLIDKGNITLSMLWKIA